jgi:hypothetical protein
MSFSSAKYAHIYREADIQNTFLVMSKAIKCSKGYKRTGFQFILSCKLDYFGHAGGGCHP